MTKRTKRFPVLIVAVVLLAACNREPQSTGPKFTGRLILLSGDVTTGANLIELTPAPAAATYNLSTLATGVFEAAASPDRTHLIYATKDEIIWRDLHTGAFKSLIKGSGLCLAWSPDNNRFSYKQKAEDKPNGAATKLYVSDLDGKTKLIWDDPFDPTTHSSGASAHSSSCAQWISPNRLVFDRLLGAVAKQTKGGELLKPNTTTVATVGDTVKLVDDERKWSVEAVCPAGSGALLRPADQAQPILFARNLDGFKTLDPKPIDCSGCRFVGFAAQSCFPFFIRDATSTTTELVSLNPTNWQRQGSATINQTFSLNARMLIKSSARLMVIGDVPAKLLLIDTESGDLTPFFPESATAARNAGPLQAPVPVAWIEN